MTKPLKYLSVCSGIEAASVAFHPYGWRPVAFSEIDKAASRVLAHHYPDVPNWGDMTKFQEWPDATVDVLCGGTPCQSFSVAGLRQGLADPRGNLMLTFGAIAGRYRPKWLVWENVPGVLSSNGGRDFGSFLGLITGRNIEPPATGWRNSGIIPGIADAYGVAYRVLDAQHVRTCRFPLAVPQRRRRVFVVGYIGDWRRSAAVLFDRESLSGHPAPRRKAGQGATRGVEFGPAGGGFADVNPTLDTRAKDGPIRNQLAGAVLCAEIAPTLNANFGDKQGLEDQHINGGVACSLPPVSHCLNAGGMGRIDYESETFIPTTGGVFDVAHALRGEGFDASEDGTGRGTPIVPVAGALCRDTFSGGASGRPESAAAGHFVPVAIQERAISENPASGPDGAGVKQDGSSYTLEARAVPQAVAFQERGRSDGRSCEFQEQLAYALTAPVGGGRAQERNIATPWAVRRLTPRECERLQGFPDDYTTLATAAKPQADGPRYKQLGNSWAVNCIDWIAERICEVDSWDHAA